MYYIQFIKFNLIYSLKLTHYQLQMKKIKNQNSNPNQMQQNNSSNQKLIGWLDDFGKQLSSRQLNKTALEQQIAILSKAYDQAQQKLLQTQKLLLNQAVFADKQRSIIQILKNILCGNVDDDSILSFIANLQQDNDPKHQIKSELIQIKQLLNERKLKRKNEMNGSQLKKQLIKVEEEKKELMEDMERLLIENQNYEESFVKLKEQKYDLENKIRNISQQLQKQQKNNKIKRQNDKSIQQKLEQDYYALKLKNQMLFQTNQQTINQIKKIQIKISQIYTDIEPNKQKLSNQITINQTYQILTQIQQKVNKYRAKLKGIKKQQKQQVASLRQISLMKQFLSDQAVSLFKQFQNCKQQCIEREILQLARMQRDRLRKLEECQQKLWKYKVRLMQEEETFMPSQNKNRSRLSSMSKIKNIKDEKIQTAQFSI